LHLALDVGRMNLFVEVQMLRNLIPKKCTSLKAQKYTINNNFTKLYPDMIINLKILQTICVTTLH